MDQGNREAPGKITRRLACFTVALAGLFLTLTSCLQTVPGDLTDNERLWQSQNISNYDFVLERQ
ncbi:MAG: hypothetical protein Q8O43_09665 [Dehalococcoidia bacterium]|nr:hypothetical protein [Dehalococcoidia bacterium]